jgi:RND family efflux transporter MFP subunit
MTTGARSEATQGTRREGDRQSRMLRDTTVAAALITLALALAGCKTSAQDDPRTQPELVRVTTVATPAGGSGSFTGAVTARVQSDLGFRVSGKVIRRMVDVGQTVASGQPLMQIDITDYMHAITTQSENVAAARARADQAAADELRYRGLVRTGAVSASTYDQIKAAADSAQAQLAAAVAQEKIARDQGDYSILYADSDGTVVQTLAEPGQVVAAGQTVVKLAHAGPREAAVYLPETVRPVLGSVAQATLYGAVKSAPARLRQLSDSADPATRTFEARYVLEGKNADAPLGATVTIRLRVPSTAGSLVVPNAAITDRGNGPGVWIVDEASRAVTFRPVTILRLGEEETYVGGGLRSGEHIIALGAHLLTEGQHIRVAENAPDKSVVSSR